MCASSGGSRRTLHDLIRRCGSSFSMRPGVATASGASAVGGGAGGAGAAATRQNRALDWQAGVWPSMSQSQSHGGGSAAASPVMSQVSTPGAAAYPFRVTALGLLHAGERSAGPATGGGGCGGGGGRTPGGGGGSGGGTAASGFIGEPGSPAGSSWASPVKLTRLVSGPLPCASYTTSYMQHAGAGMQVRMQICTSSVPYVRPFIVVRQVPSRSRVGAHCAAVTHSRTSGGAAQWRLCWLRVLTQDAGCSGWSQGTPGPLF